MADGEDGDKNLPATVTKDMLTDAEKNVLFGRGRREGEDVVQTLHDAATGISKLAAQHVAKVLTGDIPSGERMTVRDRFAMEAMPRVSAKVERTGDTSAPKSKVKDVTPTTPPLPGADPIGEAAAGVGDRQSVTVGTRR